MKQSYAIIIEIDEESNHHFNLKKKKTLLKI
jgi:hypothetical protein